LGTRRSSTRCATTISPTWPASPNPTTSSSSRPTRQSSTTLRPIVLISRCRPITCRHSPPRSRPRAVSGETTPTPSPHISPTSLVSPDTSGTFPLPISTSTYMPAPSPTCRGCTHRRATPSTHPTTRTQRRAPIVRSAFTLRAPRRQANDRFNSPGVSAGSNGRRRCTARASNSVGDRRRRCVPTRSSS
jgi:hypothetical protein